MRTKPLRWSWMFLIAGLVSQPLSGCAGASHQATSRKSAPGLAGDTGLRNSGGSNPNAPFAVMDHSPRLMPRPELSADSGAAPCTPAGLAVLEVAANVNGAYRVVRLAFVNRGDVPCTLAGYPAVSLLSANGAPIGSLAIEKATAQDFTAEMNPGSAQSASTELSPTVVLPVNGKAFFQLGWVTGDGCPAVSRIVVAAPRTTRSFTLNHPLAICDGRIRITAVSQDENGKQ